jgi:hypothetical protein
VTQALREVRLKQSVRLHRFARVRHRDAEAAVAQLLLQAANMPHRNCRSTV